MQCPKPFFHRCMSTVIDRLQPYHDPTEEKAFKKEYVKTWLNNTNLSNTYNLKIIKDSDNDNDLPNNHIA